MTKIIPSILRRMREVRRFSQEELAAKARIDKQTISRIERGADRRVRNRTVESLARALNIDAAVLSGEATLADRQRSSGPTKSQFNVNIHTGARNALFLIGDRYGVRPWQVLELAPFLFCWAAEASLRLRSERLKRVEQARDNARDAESAIRHLPIPEFSLTDEKISAERESIDAKDLFATFVENNENLTKRPFPDDAGGGYDNPLARFLNDLASEFETSMMFEEFSGLDSPIYKVCKEEASSLANGDSELADDVLEGRVPLWEMPKEIRHDFTASSAWLRARAAGYRREMHARTRNKLEKVFS